jgi:hypothetical protein
MSILWTLLEAVQIYLYIVPRPWLETEADVIVN